MHHGRSLIAGRRDAAPAPGPDEFSVARRNAGWIERLDGGHPPHTRQSIAQHLLKTRVAKIADEDDRKIMEADFATIGP